MVTLLDSTSPDTTAGSLPSPLRTHSHSEAHEIDIAACGLALLGRQVELLHVVIPRYTESEEEAVPVPVITQTAEYHIQVQRLLEEHGAVRCSKVAGRDLGVVSHRQDVDAMLHRFLLSFFWRLQKRGPGEVQQLSTPELSYFCKKNVLQRLRRRVFPMLFRAK